MLGNVMLTKTIFSSESSAWERMKVSIDRDFDLIAKELFYRHLKTKRIKDAKYLSFCR